MRALVRLLATTVFGVAILGVAAAGAATPFHPVAPPHPVAPAHPVAPVHPAVTDPIFGLAPVFAPKGKPTSVIVLLSDETGFGRDEIKLAVGFVGQGSLVIGLNWPAWRSQLAQRRGQDCVDLLGHIEAIVYRVERERGVEPFITPIIAGVGLGGAAARALAPAAASHRIAGVVALRSGTFLESAMPICGGIARRRSDGYVYETSRHAAARVREAETEEEAAEAAEDLLEQTPKPEKADLSDLPLTIVKPLVPPRRMVLLLTGDGGVGGLDVGLANALAARKIGVVTLDSRRYFWTEREPEVVARDIQRILAHFRREWPIEGVALVGYSFGANFLPLVYKHLPGSVRRSVALVSLLALSPAADLQIELDDDDYPNAKPLLPDAARIDAPQVQCVYGKDDRPAAMACPALAAARPGIDLHRTAGGHGFDGDVEALAGIVATPLLAAPPHREAVPVPRPSPRRSPAPAPS